MEMDHRDSDIEDSPMGSLDIRSIQSINENFKQLKDSQEKESPMPPLELHPIHSQAMTEMFKPFKDPQEKDSPVSLSELRAMQTQAMNNIFKPFKDKQEKDSQLLSELCTNETQAMNELFKPFKDSQDKDSPSTLSDIRAMQTQAMNEIFKPFKDKQEKDSQLLTDIRAIDTHAINEMLKPYKDSKEKDSPMSLSEIRASQNQAMNDILFKPFKDTQEKNSPISSLDIRSIPSHAFFEILKPLKNSQEKETIPQQGCRDMFFLDKKSPVINQSGTELSEPEEDSREASRPPVDNGTAPDAAMLNKIKQEREEVKAPTSTAPPPFSLPVPFPFPHPFLPPAPQTFQTQPTHSSASSHSSESSSGSQQTWSFEEQFKQVRQLYEISDEPKRKEFLDDLFSFMQRRGTPINRLPIMAKSVLDLFELYNLVIQRGGLVDVINKKLWQEIIKGLHLPSSITSAAFTLRTQYMKYLYPYECEKRRLSTPNELQAAIDGNRREGRRGSYGTYAEMMQRSPTQHSPLSLVTGRTIPVNGTTNHHHHLHLNNNNNHIPPHQTLLPSTLTGGGGLVPAEIEYRMVEYVKMLNKEMRNTSTTPPIHKQNSPPSSPTEGTGVSINPLEMSRLTLWNLYNSTPPEMQKEALNLEKRDDPLPPPPKRHYPDNDDVNNSGTHIKISSRGDARGGSDNSLVVSMDINGTMYQGVLFAQTTTRSNRLQS